MLEDKDERETEDGATGDEKLWAHSGAFEDQVLENNCSEKSNMRGKNENLKSIARDHVFISWAYRCTRKEHKLF